MKKGLLTTLLLASGAALAVYLLKEEQNKKSYDNDDEKRMIKLRTEEENDELVRTIQEIENLPFRRLEEPIEKAVTIKPIQPIELNREHVRVFGLNNEESHEEIENQNFDNVNTLDLPSFIHESPLDYVETEEELLNNEDTSELELPKFFSEVSRTPEVPLPFVNALDSEDIDLTSLIDDEDLVEAFDLPSFMKETVVEDTAPIHPDNSVVDNQEVVAVEEDFAAFDLPNFMKETVVEESPKIDILSVEEGLEVTEELPVLSEDTMVTNVDEDLLNLYASDDSENFGETAIFDLPKMFRENINAVQDMDNTINMPGESKEASNPLFDFHQDELEEIDLSELFNAMSKNQESLQNPFETSLDETSEIKLMDIDEEEIKRLFNTDDSDLEEISLEDIEELVKEPELRTELSEGEFEEFKKRLVHIEEDDIDLINLNDSKPFDTVEKPSHEEIDIINFGNIVAEPTIKLEDIVFENIDPITNLESVDELEEIEIPTYFDGEDTQELTLPSNLQEDTSEISLDEINLHEMLEEDDELENLEIVEEASTPLPSRANDDEFPEAVHQISSLYPYLNLKFINAVFDNFDLFNEEFEVGSGCRITHRVQFPESQNLMAFIDIIKDLGYEIAGTDENHNILITLEFENEESKILSEIYNISNQVNYLDGLYKGYELEHI